MTRPRIVVSNPVHPPVLDLLRREGDVIANPSPTPWTPAELAEHIADASALMAFMPDRVDGKLLAGAPRLRIVACALRGYDNFDIEACTRSGVWVSIVPDLLIAPTAELAIGLAIALGRHVRPADQLVRSGAHRGWRAAFYGSGLAGAVVGIVGMGRLGQAIAKRLQAFDCAQLLGVDPIAFDLDGVTRVSLEQALADAHYLVVAAPLTPRTLALINAEALAHARAGQLIINVGRGSVVDETAVADALEEGRLGGYAADVFGFEDWAVPGRPEGIDVRLLSLPNTLFTPHLGSAVREVRLQIELCAAGNIVAALQGRNPPEAINHPSPVRAGAAHA
jgi:phosphonate dehydrogenase